MDARSPTASAQASPAPSSLSASAREPPDDGGAKKRGRPNTARTAAPKEKIRKTAAAARQRVLPVDVDRQCGVPLADETGKPTGGLCARSLTCKTHSMGAKRAVAGRSQPYDVLLVAYQKKNQLKSAEKGPGGRAAAAAARAAAAANALESDSDDSPKLPDSEEVAEVLRGAVLSNPQPLERALVVPTRLRSQRVSLSEFLYKATTQVSPPPASASPLAAIMVSTQSIVGRCVLFEKHTHAQSVRPSLAFASERLARQQLDARALQRANAARANAAALAGAAQRDARPATK